MAPTSLSKSELLAQELQALEANLTQISLRLLARRRLLATAESCTGGMIAAACTDLSGSSQWFERGFVTYSNEANAEMLGLPPVLIEQHGAVSEPVARAMADGALAHSRAQVSLAVTGVAGPTGGTEAKPLCVIVNMASRESDPWPQAEIARLLGVSAPYVHKVLRRKLWRETRGGAA